MIFRPNSLDRTFYDGGVQIFDPVHASLRFELFPGVIQIKEHDHSGLGIKAGKSDQANPDRDAHVVMEEVQHPERPHQREGYRQKDDKGFYD